MSSSARRVLLTGATGFIGAHLAETLSAREDCKVSIIKRSSSDTWRIDGFADRLRIFNCDEPAALNEIVRDANPDVVMHLATHYIKRHLPKDVAPMVRANVEFPTHLLEAMRENGVQHFINTGSFFEYDMGEKPLGEDSEKSPYNLYASTKLAFEEIAKFYSYSHGVKCVTLKLFAPYGYMDNDKKLVTHIILSALSDKEIPITAGEQRWDFTYVKDIVSAYIVAMQHVAAMTTPHEAFNIGSGKAVSVKEMVSTIERILGNPMRVKFGAVPYAQDEIFFVEADISKAKERLKWEPEHSLEQGLRETISYYKNKLSEVKG